MQAEMEAELEKLSTQILQILASKRSRKSIGFVGELVPDSLASYYQ